MDKEFKNYKLVLVAAFSYIIGSVFTGILQIPDSLAVITTIATVFAAFGTVGALVQMKNDQKEAKQKQLYQEKVNFLVSKFNNVNSDIERYNSSILSIEGYLAQLLKEYKFSSIVFKNQSQLNRISKDALLKVHSLINNPNATDLTNEFIWKEIQSITLDEFYDIQYLCSTMPPVIRSERTLYKHDKLDEIQIFASKYFVYNSKYTSLIMTFASDAKSGKSEFSLKRFLQASKKMASTECTEGNIKELRSSLYSLVTSYLEYILFLSKEIYVRNDTLGLFQDKISLTLLHSQLTIKNELKKYGENISITSNNLIIFPDESLKGINLIRTLPRDSYITQIQDKIYVHT